MIQFSLLGFDRHGADTEKTFFKYIDNPGIRFIFSIDHMPTLSVIGKKIQKIIQFFYNRH